MDETAAGALGGFLIGYWLSTDRDGVRVSLAGKLGRGGAELIEACRARLQAMPVAGVRLDLNGLALVDETGAGSLAAMCSALRRDGFQVEVCGPDDVVAAVQSACGPSWTDPEPSPLRTRGRPRR